MNFGYHLAVVPPSGVVFDGRKNSDFVQKQKQILPSAHFGLFLPSGPTVLAHFWLCPPTGPLWILNINNFFFAPIIK
jgi:hypothetical protein